MLNNVLRPWLATNAILQHDFFLSANKHVQVHTLRPCRASDIQLSRSSTWLIRSW